MNFSDVEALKAVLALLAPGFIILMVQEAHKVGPRDSLQQRLFSYAVASTAYFAAIAPLVRQAGELLSIPTVWVQFAEYAILPAALGVVLAVCRSRRWLDRFSRLMKLPPIHHIPTAWDWAFPLQGNGVFVIATLQNGDRFAGPWTQAAFASSSSGERDLYIPEVWNAKEEGPWERLDPIRGILLCGRDIRSIEFFYEGENNDKKAKSGEATFKKGLHSAAAKT